MSTHQHTRTAIATGTCLTFGVAVAVAVGAVPQVSSSHTPTPAVSHGVVQPALARLLLNPESAVRHHAAAHHRSHHVLNSTHARVMAPAAAQSSAAEAAKTDPNQVVSGVTVEPAGATGPSAESANIRHAAAHHKKKHHKKHHKPAHKPAKPQKAARTTPSASAVSAAISGLRNFVHTPLTPTSAQVAQFGDEVCTAFDNGSTFAHVKSVILAKVQQLPFTTVTAGAADYVVKTAVSLYCPGYKSKVS